MGFRSCGLSSWVALEEQDLGVQAVMSANWGMYCKEYRTTSEEDPLGLLLRSDVL